MREYILLFINGQRYEIRGEDVFLTLSDYLRQSLGLCGTKIVCSEGDCGSCSVLVSRIDSSVGGRYVPIDSCIRFVFQLDGTHIVTVEGLSGSSLDNGSQLESRSRTDSDGFGEQGCGLNAVQRAMIECHGSQCGFCTPGFVIAMTGLLQNQEPLSVNEWRSGLTGNLCRCTGYSPIIAAGLKAQTSDLKMLDEIYASVEMVEAYAEFKNDSISIRSHGGQSKVFCPASLNETLRLLAEHPDARIAAGATDVGVQHNKSPFVERSWVDLNRVSELEGVSILGNTLEAGARATWTEIETVCETHLPEFGNVISVFGSPQIRHVGTIGGNVVNASPIADSLPLLFVCHAQLTVASVDGIRTIDINEFYRGYKEMDLRPGELLVKVSIPLPSQPGSLRLYKVSRRRDLDISSFTAAIVIETEKPANGSLNRSEIRSAKIAFGAVGPMVIRLWGTERFLTGKPLSEETMRAAGDIAVAEICPISDVRGSDEYRNQLARNILLKYYHQSQSGQLSAPRSGQNGGHDDGGPVCHR